jgi:hypothetical protein
MKSLFSFIFHLIIIHPITVLLLSFFQANVSPANSLQTQTMMNISDKIQMCTCYFAGVTGDFIFAKLIYGLIIILSHYIHYFEFFSKFKPCLAHLNCNIQQAAATVI